MKNILLFTHSLSGGGAEKTVRRLAKYINVHDLGIKAYVCVVYDDPKYHEEVDELIILKHKSAPDDGYITKAINVLKQMKEMKTIKKRYKIDTCISFLPGADIINVFSGVGEKQIVSVRNKESLFTHNIFKKIYVKIAYSRCDKIVAVTEAVRQDCIHFFGAPEDKVITIHNAVSELNQAPEIKQSVLEFIEGHKVIVNVGRLTQQKGQEYLIRAFAKVVKKHKNYRLLILGEGELRDHLNKLTFKLGIHDMVMLAGNVVNPAAYLKRSDLFVLSSNVEGMPNVLLEAMQCSLPCISTECGAREILAPDTDTEYKTSDIEIAKYGILVPVCGEQASDIETGLVGKEQILASAIEKLIDDTDLQLLFKERADECLARFEMSTLVDKWVQVI